MKELKILPVVTLIASAVKNLQHDEQLFAITGHGPKICKLKKQQQQNLNCYFFSVLESLKFSI